MKMLEAMANENPDEVLTVTPDMDTVTMKKVTVMDRLKDMIKAEKYDIKRLDVLDSMIAEEEGVMLKNPDGPDEEKNQTKQ